MSDILHEGDSLRQETHVSVSDDESQGSLRAQQHSARQSPRQTPIAPRQPDAPSSTSQDQDRPATPELSRTVDEDSLE